MVDLWNGARQQIRRTFGGLLALTLAVTAADAFEADLRPVLQKFCFDCHDHDTQKGGVNLAAFTNAASLLQNPKLWETGLRQLGERAMPPREKPQPEPPDFLRLIEGLQGLLDHPDPAAIPRDPGATRPRRLSRTEYNLTMRDLLGATNRPADSFPPDGGGGGGFDNNADTLFVPPILLERYLTAAEELLTAAPLERLQKVAPVWYRHDSGVAAENLRWFLRRAWRRPATDEEITRWLQPYHHARQAGHAFLPALKRSYEAALVSPHFLFRTEAAEAPGPMAATNYFPRVGDFELASRLSYFLWASQPDDTLLAAAEKGRLRDPARLVAEIRRLLSDPKARAFSEQFAGQWLGTRQLTAKATPDGGKFPTYTPELAAAMMREPVEFFAALVQGDGNLLQLLDADFTYLNRSLARHYGITNFPGTASGGSHGSNEFVRVSLLDRRRGGVVTMAAVLTQTSYPRRTSPVLRGKWLLEEILGTPAPPPPPLVATLPPDDQVRDDLTFRQRLEKHREKKACASCHSRLDPPGFALENYDGIGVWRDQIDGRPVDAKGILSSGAAVDGPAALKDALLARKDLFVRHLTEKLLAYALGRGLEYYDIPAVKEVQRQVAADGYRMETWIIAVATSFPMTHRRPENFSTTAGN